MTRRNEAPSVAMGLVAPPLSTVGYCSRCNATYRDILTHRTAQDHHRRSHCVESGIWLRSRAGGAVRPWMVAMRQDDEETAFETVTSYRQIAKDEEYTLLW